MFFMENYSLFLTAQDRKINYHKNCFYLGRWCLNEIEYYKKKDNVNFIEYHWDDRKKLKKDYSYLNSLHSQLIKILSEELNKLHSTEKTIRYWQILLDPWLMDYIGILYDRWETIRMASEENSKIFNVFFYSDLKDLDVPFCYQQLSSYGRTDKWNQSLYQRIIHYKFKNKFKINLSKVHFSNYNDESLNIFEKNKNKISRLKLLDDIYNIICDKLFNKYKIVLIDSYFTLLANIKFNLFHKQLPRSFSSQFADKKRCISHNINREDLKINFNTSCDFESFIKLYIRYDLPTSIIEYFDFYNDFVGNNSLKPKVIISANSYWYSIPKKYWIAERVSEGVKLISTDHGGSLPAYREHFEFEENISDLRGTWFIPWHSKHIQAPPGKLLYLKKIYNLLSIFLPKNHCSVIGYSGSGRWAHRATFYPLSYQSLSVYEMSMNFFSFLDDKIFNQLKIRPQPHSGINVKKLYVQNLGDEKVSTGNYYNFLFKSKVIVCLYPETTYIEAMSLNIPTILLYPKKYFERNKITENIIKDLEKNKMLFNDPIMAANHLNEIWTDPNRWWNSEEVKTVRKKFHELAGNGNNRFWLKKWNAIVNSIL